MQQLHIFWTVDTRAVSVWSDIRAHFASTSPSVDICASIYLPAAQHALYVCSRMCSLHARTLVLAAAISRSFSRTRSLSVLQHQQPQHQQPYYAAPPPKPQAYMVSYQVLPFACAGKNMPVTQIAAPHTAAFCMLLLHALALKLWYNFLRWQPSTTFNVQTTTSQGHYSGPPTVQAAAPKLIGEGSWFAGEGQVQNEPKQTQYDQVFQVT